MKKYLFATLSSFVIVGCGGGGSTDNFLSQEDSYKAYVPLQDNPKTFLCSKDKKPNMYDLEVYYDTKSKCSAYAQKWLDDFNKNDTPETTEKQDALNHLNAIRAKVGLPIFKGNKKLEEAAKYHAYYLGDVYDNYDVNLAHSEDNTNYPSSYYRGKTSTDRALKAGYKTDYTGEVISFDDSNSTESIDGLLDSLYHRIALLWNFSNEIGIGGSEKYYTLQAYVHLMGDKLDRWKFLESISPRLVVYPYENQTNFSTCMQAESPDPTPDISHDVGNPITLSFNEQKVDTVEVKSFKLYYDNNDTEVGNIRLLSAGTDVNGRLSSFDYALMPLDVLQSNTTYRVEVNYVVDGKNEFKGWKFTTK